MNMAAESLRFGGYRERCSADAPLARYPPNLSNCRMFMSSPSEPSDGAL